MKFLSSHEPFVIGELIAMVVRWHDIHQQNVFSFRVQPGDLHFKAREHSPVEKSGKQKIRMKIIHVCLNVILCERYK